MALWVGLALFIIVDAVVVYVVLTRALAKRVGTAGAGRTGLTDVRGLVRFANDAAAEARGYFGANYGGDPASLPGVMQGLVDRLAQRAGEQGMTIDRSLLKQFAATAAISLKAAKASDVRAALESVA